MAATGFASQSACRAGENFRYAGHRTDAFWPRVDTVSMGKLRKRTDEDRLPLSLAAAIVFDQLSGGIKRSDDLREALNRTAVAIIHVVPVSVFDPERRRARAVSPGEIGQIKVTRGAAQLTLPDGTSFLHATVTRAEMNRALQLLKTAGESGHIRNVI